MTARTGMDWIVLIAVAAAVAFVVAWLSSAKLRTWIERPKYRFLADVEGYDRSIHER